MSFPSDEFPKASFDGLEFAYTDVTVKGGIRYSMHEFPHSAGGEPEKMGRKAYNISFRAHFHEIPGTQLATEYIDAYPDGLRIMREKFEVQLTAPLVIPTVGKIMCVATDWVQRFDVRSPTGETFEMEFVEDQLSVFLLTGTGAVAASAALVEEASDAAFAAAALADFKKQDTVGFFQALNDAVTLVQGALGAADAFSRVLEGKLQGLVNLLSYADGQLEEMQNPSNHLVVNALKDLQLAARSLAENVTESQQRVLTYTTPRLMSVGQVSTVLYGTSEHGADVLQLNAINDAFAIPAGTKLKYLSAPQGA